MSQTGTDEEGPLAVVGLCCLIDNGTKCHRMYGNASFGKRVQKSVTQKNLNLVLNLDSCHIYMCDFHQELIRNARIKRKPKKPKAPAVPKSKPAGINLCQLHLSTLRRYKKHYNIPTKTGINKTQLAGVLTKHAKSMEVDEKDVLSYFVYSVKTKANKLDKQ